jgi:hypothetical protein
MNIVTLDDLTRAIAKRLSIAYAKARQYAIKVLDFFGYEDRVIDNLLDRDDRQLFYQLQEHGILHAEREEMTLYDGRGWRIHYWCLNKDIIFESGTSCYEEHSVDADQALAVSNQIDIYENISTDMWLSRKTA